MDSWGRIIGVGFSDGVKEGYEYTPARQICKTVDGNWNFVEYCYNSLGIAHMIVYENRLAERFVGTFV